MTPWTGIPEENIYVNIVGNLRVYVHQVGITICTRITPLPRR